MTRGDFLGMFLLLAGPKPPRVVGIEFSRERLLADLRVQATQGSSALVSHMNAVEDLLRYIGDPEVTAVYRRVPVPIMSHEAQPNHDPY